MYTIFIIDFVPAIWGQLINILEYFVAEVIVVLECFTDLIDRSIVTCYVDILTLRTPV